MYFSKKGEIVTFVVITVLILASAVNSDINIQTIGDGTYNGEINLTSADIKFNGITANDDVGKSLLIKDINGDNLSDIIIGVPDATANSYSSAGKVYIYYGSLSSSEYNLSSADLELHGEYGTYDAGGSLTSGDINNDGYNDLIVSAVGAIPYTPSDVTTFGEFYLFYGPLTSTGTLNLTTANVTFRGIDEQDFDISNINQILSSADVNNDSFDDIIIGAEKGDANGNADSGETYVIYGGSSLDSIFNLTYANVTINGVNSGDFSGSEVSSGDINGDGVSDIIIVAEYGDNGHNNEGQTYVVFGNSNLDSEINLSDANVTIDGVTSNDFSGSSISTGDINNDQIDDLVIGANQADANGNTDAGQAYLVYGSTSLSGTIELDDANVTFNGIAESDYAGYSTSLADLNLDGYSDIIISAYLNNASSNTDSGQVYVFYGSNNLATEINMSDANITYNGVNASDYAGYHLTTGDTNNDGFPDLLIGAYGAGPNGVSSAGEIYLIQSKITCNVINENLTLNQDINANGDCFTINASNILIDGNGYTVYGNSSGTGINLSNVENVTVQNINLNGFTNAINLENSANNNNLISSSLLNNTNNDLIIVANGGVDNILTNVTFNQSFISVGANSNFFVKWYVSAQVADSDLNVLESANFSAYNNSGGFETSLLTGSDGISNLSLIEYEETSSGKNYHTNHTINVTKSLYSEGTKNINLTTTNNTNFVLVINFGCGEITEDVSFSPTTYNSNGTCFTVGADDLVVDANGLNVIGNTSGDGININGYNNFTISNIILNNFSNGINLTSTNDSYFYDSTIINSGASDILAMANAGYNNTFVNMTFNVDNISVGVNSNIFVKWYVDVTVNNSGYLINNSNVSGYNITGDLEYSNTTENGLSRLLLTDFVETSSGKTYLTPHNITISKSGYIDATENVNLTSTNSTSITIDFFGNASCGTINESIVFQTSTINASGTCFTIGAGNIVIDGNNSLIIGNGAGYSFYLSEKNNVTITGFNLSNFSTGIYLTGSSNNTFNDFYIHDSISYGVYFYATSTENNFTNGYIFNSSSYDLYLDDAISMYGHRDQDNYLTNFSIDKSSIYAGTDATLTMKWYADVQVNDTNSNSLSNVNITAYKADGTIEESKLTSALGTSQLLLSEFVKDEYGYTYVTPHTINIFKAGYLENSSILYLDETNNTNLNYTLEEIVSGMNLTSNATLSNNMSSNGTFFIIGADDITINGDNNIITGNGSGIAFDVSNRSGVIINNIKITNFSQGIDLFQSNDTIISNVELYNNTYGVIFNVSNNNLVSSSIIENNTHSSVFAINDGGTNNTLLNTTINIDEINVSGTATVFLKWYVLTNVTFDSLNYPLQNANVTGYYNNTNTTDYSGLTNSDGLINLELSELKKNSSGVTYLTPHNISSFFNSSFGFSENETSLNLTLTNNTQVNFNLNLSCTAPYDDLEINESISLCPGTYEISDLSSSGVIRVLNSNLTVTCSDTIIKGTGTDSGIGIYLNDAENVTIIDCQIEDYLKGISITKSSLSGDNFTASGLTISGTSQAIEIDHNLTNFNLTNFSFTGIGTYGIFSNAGPSNSFISNGTFSGSNSEGIRFVINNASNFTITDVIFDNLKRGITLEGNNFSIRNNTFSNSGYGIYIGAGTDNQIYYNTFEDATFYHAYVLSTGNEFNTSVNVSGTMSAQGNSWDDYCSLTFSDSNGDTYADAGSSYPYNSTNGGNVFGNVNDYGPKVISCPVSTPAGSRGGRSSSTSPSAGGDVVITKTSEVSKKSTKNKEAVPSSEFYDLEETKKFLKSELTQTSRVDRDTSSISVSLENTGNKTMRLFPNIFQEIDDPFYIVTRKTLGFEGSYFNKIASLSYSKNPISGRLLRAELVNSEEIIILPGEKIERTIQIKEGLTIPRQMKIKFSTFGETVIEKEIIVEKQAVTGSAIDLDNENNLLDLYIVIVPQQIFLESQQSQSNSLTGAAISDLVPDNITGTFRNTITNTIASIMPTLVTGNNYMVEFNINKESGGTLFGDVYGPYKTLEEQSLIFAQQIKYDPLIYNGDYNVLTKIYLNGKVVAENQFKAHFGKK
jgi:hypothetical protein